MLRVDLESRTVEASVRELVMAPMDVPRPAGMLAGARAALGTDVHRQIREEREAADVAYVAEVSLELDRVVDGFAVRLRGRADGILETEDGLLVEEVKSTDLAGEAFHTTTLTENADAAKQVRLYALLLALARPDKDVTARLVLVSIVDGARRELSVPFEEERAEQLLDHLVRGRIDVARTARKAARRRARVAERLEFPYSRRRPQQSLFADAVAEGLEADRPVLATAPTGVGKTIGALLPALRYALANDALLFFLTAKTTQQELVVRTFRDIAKAAGVPDADLRALTFREKRRMCPPGTLLCHPDHCRHLAGFLQRMTRETAIDELLDGEGHIEPDRVYEVGEAHGACPYGLALVLVLQVDLVVCDVNYVYDPAVSLGIFAKDVETREAVVVVDEAHNLFDRAREYYSPFVKRDVVADLQARVTAGEFRAPKDRSAADALPGLASPSDGTRLFAEMGGWLARLGVSIDESLRLGQDEGAPLLDECRPVRGAGPLWDGLAEGAASLMVRYGHYQQVHGIVRPDDDLLGLLGTVLAVRDLVLLDAPEFVPYAAGARAPDGAGFGILCVNPAEKLAERHRQVRGTVAMSATFDPLDYYEDVLGFGDLDPLRVALPSPFPAENRCVAFVPSISTTWRDRPRHLDGIAHAIRDVIGVRPGNYVAYFPSFRFLEDVRARLGLPAGAVLAQERGMAVADRAPLIERFVDTSTPSLLLAVMGGVFAEGIDLPGEALVGAIVVGPGLPQVGFERTLMQHYFDERCDRGFAYAMLFPGMQRVIQSAGRVHRTPQDRGVIVLLGQRFLRSPYVDCLPSWWWRFSPEECVARDLVARLARFWE